MADLKVLAEQLVNLSIKQANELFAILKHEHGIEPAAAAPVMMAAAPAASGNETVEEQTAFDVILKSPGNSKLTIVRQIKELTGLSLTEAKALVDGAPATLKEKLSKEEATSMKKKLEEGGAEVELK